MMISSRVIGCCLAWFVAGTLASSLMAQDAELRTWTSSSGAFSLKAKMVSHDPTHVVLEKEDGNKIKVEISKLSAADQKWIRQAGRKAKADKPKSKGPMNFATGVALEYKEFVGWQLSPDPRKTVSLAEPKAFTFPEYSKTFSQNEYVLTDRSKSKLFFLHGYKRSGNQLTGHVFDLEKGERLGSTFTIDTARPWDISSNLQNLAVGSFDIGGHRTLGWLAVEGNRIVAKKSWIAYPNMESRTGSPYNVNMARFVGNDHLLTWGGRTRRVSQGPGAGPVVALWDLANAELKWWTASKKPAVSANGKFALIPTYENEIVAVELPSGKILGRQQVDLVGQLSINPSGEKFVSVNMRHRKTIVFDLASGKIVDDFIMDGMGEVFEWIDDRRFLTQFLSRFSLIDLDYRGKIWEYWFERSKGSAFNIDAAGRAWFFQSGFDEGSDGRLGSIQIPHDGLKSWLDANKPEDFLVLKPGTPIRMQVSAIVNDASDEEMEEYSRQMSEIVRQDYERGNRGVNAKRRYPAMRFTTKDVSYEAQQILEKKLADAGFTVSPTASIVLDFRIAPALNLRNKHLDKLKESPTYGPKAIAYQGEILYEGRSIWSTGYVSLSLQKPYDTARVESLKYIDKIVFGSHFADLRHRNPNYSTVDQEGIVDRSYKR